MVNQPKHDVLQAISDPTRRSILKLLTEKELSIDEIAENFPISRTAVNKHLYFLSISGLVISQKIGRETRYRLNPDPLVEIQNWLTFLENYWEDKLSALKKFVEEDLK
ncbi:transcriptional regulator [Oceanobacillus arenosus]|uniref:Transcriptional regulator n=1 Tax=Oceanobacillus arenosus TaxID=1229153 RepID=A0A3D8PW27_9BACI|nr:metalloregulator ArsR/SmtB family transcription factor [Oceanobacillus arenosus]RDW20350.1 transcriptional regulator [Oceanobacillus arenosus]